MCEWGVYAVCVYMVCVCTWGVCTWYMGVCMNTVRVCIICVGYAFGWDWEGWSEERGDIGNLKVVL